MIEHPSEVTWPHERVRAQDEQIKQLTEEMAQLRQTVAQLRQMMAPQTPAPAVAHKRTGRRGMLKAAGAAALGVAAVAVTGAPVIHAGSGDGATFQLGQVNAAPDTTLTTGTSGSTPGNLLGASDTNNTAANAIFGSATSGFGLAGSSSTGVDIYSYGTGRVRLALTAAIGAPTVGTYAAGEMIRDHIGDMYICVGSGTPGSWYKVAAFDSFFAGGAISLYNPPRRLYDSRTHDGPLHGASFRDIFAVAAPGMVGNLTVTNTTAGGYLVIYPTGASTPSASTVNYLQGQTNANSFIVATGTDFQVRVHNFSSGDADFIIDITGFVGEEVS